jgi:hypothetical protein
MPRYLLETYVSRADAADLRDTIARIELAAHTLTTDGRAVGHVRSTFLPEDEVCLHLFEADSPALVEEVSRQAGVAFERIVEAVPIRHGSEPIEVEGAPR